MEIQKRTRMGKMESMCLIMRGVMTGSFWDDLSGS